MKELCVYTIQGVNICEVPLIIVKVFLGIIGAFVIFVLIGTLVIYIKNRFF